MALVTFTLTIFLTLARLMQYCYNCSKEERIFDLMHLFSLL